MIRVCPKRDAICPHGMNCPYTVDRYTCKPEPERADRLLDWLTHNHRPLSLFRECDEDGGCWVVADNATNAVLGSGGSATEALRAAHASQHA